MRWLLVSIAVVFRSRTAMSARPYWSADLMDGGHSLPFSGNRDHRCRDDARPADVKLHHEFHADPADLQRTAARARAVDVCGRGPGKQQPTLHQHIGSFGHDDSVESTPRPHEHSRHVLHFIQLHALDTLYQL